MRRSNNIWHILFPVMLYACKKPFQPPAIQVNYNYLVVDGVINSAPNSVTTITLTRSKNLTDTVTPRPVLNAQVTIEGETGGVYPLTGSAGGVYQSNSLTLDPSKKYRLRILAAGINYQSDFVVVKQTPPIDSITWKQDKDVTIYAHTHDPSNNTKYYRWENVETWQYDAALQPNSPLGVKNGLIYTRDSLTQFSHCWNTANSSTIIVATSENLSQDVISYTPVNVVLQNTEKIAVRYSINVRQYALTKEAYQYWQLLEKSTEQTGTIFDSQPSQLTGNIHCITNPDEPVIGFVSVSSVTEKRIFIDHGDVSNWKYISGTDCNGLLYVMQNPANFLLYDYPDTTFAPYYFVTTGSLVALGKKVCLDCTRHGGSNSKPSFWR